MLFFIYILSHVGWLRCRKGCLRWRVNGNNFHRLLYILNRCHSENSMSYIGKSILLHRLFFVHRFLNRELQSADRFCLFCCVCAKNKWRWFGIIDVVYLNARICYLKFWLLGRMHGIHDRRFWAFAIFAGAFRDFQFHHDCWSFVVWRYIQHIRARYWFVLIRVAWGWLLRPCWTSWPVAYCRHLHWLSQLGFLGRLFLHRGVAN